MLELFTPNSLFKGTVSRDFLLLVFFMYQFPPCPRVFHLDHSNFFENSRRYSQLKVCHRCQRHRWQMEKSSIIHHSIFIFSCQQFDNCSHCLPPVSLIPVVHHALPISPRILEKFEMVLMEYSGAGGKLIHEKPEAKNLVTLSL